MRSSLNKNSSEPPRKTQTSVKYTHGKEIIVVNGLDAVTVQLKAIGKNPNQLTVLCDMGRIAGPDLTDTKRSFGAVLDSICGLKDKGA